MIPIAQLYPQYPSSPRREKCRCQDEEIRNLSVAAPIRDGWAGRQVIPISCDGSLDRSIKVEVKKKHIPFGWNFSCFAAHWIE